MLASQSLYACCLWGNLQSSVRILPHNHIVRCKVYLWDMLSLPTFQGSSRCWFYHLWCSLNFTQRKNKLHVADLRSISTVFFLHPIFTLFLLCLTHDATITPLALSLYCFEGVIQVGKVLDISKFWHLLFD